MLLGNPCLIAFGAAIAAQMRCIEGTPPVFSYVQIACFAPGSLIFTPPLVCWGTAAFRPDRDDGDIALVHDAGWLLFAFPYTIFSPWLVAVALTIFSVSSKESDCPRWVGYYSVFVALSFVPDNLVFFFKDGPLVWSGVLAYSLPFIRFGTWIVVMLCFTVRAINREAGRRSPSSGRPRSGAS